MKLKEASYISLVSVGHSNGVVGTKNQNLILLLLIEESANE